MVDVTVVSSSLTHVINRCFLTFMLRFNIQHWHEYLKFLVYAKRAFFQIIIVDLLVAFSRLNCCRIDPRVLTAIGWSRKYTNINGASSRIRSISIMRERDLYLFPFNDERENEKEIGRLPRSLSLSLSLTFIDHFDRSCSSFSISLRAFLKEEIQ